MRTHVHMFVPKLGLIKQGQAYVCPQLWAFCMKILFRLFSYFWETSRQLCPQVWAFSERLAFTRYLWAFSVGQEGHTSQRSNTLVAFRRPNIGMEHSLAFFTEFVRHSLKR